MAIKSIANSAYLSALGNKESSVQKKQNISGESFKATIENSLNKVNELQLEKDRMIEEFAVGKNENVHEVMIALQKADVAMRLTSAVRNKVIEAYKQLINMPM